METALLRYCVNFSGHKKISAHQRSNSEIPKTSPGGCEDEWCARVLSRRSGMASGLDSSTTGLAFPREGLADVKQGLLAGRETGLNEPDEEGWRTYRRPDEKLGGHGDGWRTIIPYAFAGAEDCNEAPASIADLAGTEMDWRCGSPKQARLSVIVAPVLRFADNLGDDVKIENIGQPAKVINAFGPEVIGENVEGKVLSSNVAEHDGRLYYQFELEPPHVLITATAAGNRLCLFSVNRKRSSMEETLQGSEEDS
nr:Unknown protein [Arabidopsis thaliana]